MMLSTLPPMWALPSWLGCVRPSVEFCGRSSPSTPPTPLAPWRLEPYSFLKPTQNRWRSTETRFLDLQSNGTSQACNVCSNPALHFGRPQGPFISCPHWRWKFLVVTGLDVTVECWLLFQLFWAPPGFPVQRQERIHHVADGDMMPLCQISTRSQVVLSTRESC